MSESRTILESRRVEKPENHRRQYQEHKYEEISHHQRIPSLLTKGSSTLSSHKSSNKMSEYHYNTGGSCYLIR
ncbi:hypothetical protein CAAN1_10S05776 [[Candida] anglica]|uniref:Uncharacterized protein n=1 Tax=[Candida] anglica TaxID=148631 RepID=A0ABP0EEV1_9ASCO